MQKYWKGFLNKKIEELDLKNVSIQEIAGKPIADFNERDYRNPDDFVSKDKKSAGLSFEDYVKAIDTFPEEYFDLVVVDGRVRNCCVKRAIPHVKKGGYLIVDNTDRSYYLAPFPELLNSSKWEKTEFQGPVFFQHAFSKTSFFRKA